MEQTKELRSIVLLTSVAVSYHMFQRRFEDPAIKIFDRVLVVSNFDDADLERLKLSDHDKVEYYSISFVRKPNVLADLSSLYKLVIFLWRNKPSAIHTLMPKAGLLGMLAARVVGVPIRMHTFTGQVWATKTGVVRHLLKALDRLIVICSTDVLADSKSQAVYLRKEGVVTDCVVLGNGSVCGVDLSRFRKIDKRKKQALRKRNAIEAGDIVFGFLGRINKDKGVLDLIVAMKDVLERHENVWLLIGGPDEERLLCDIHEKYGLDNSSRIRVLGSIEDVLGFYSLIDVLWLPSYREGFGQTIIEAAACGIPALGSRIYGIEDAVSDGNSGWLHSAGDITQMREIAEKLVLDRDLLERAGDDALSRASNYFSSNVVMLELENCYLEKYLGL